MVTVFGLGFVGLTTALGFAHLGYEVYGIDVDDRRKATLREGKLPFYEPYMEEVLQKHLNGNFHVTEDAAEAVRNSEYLFFCVGTPYGKDGSADLTYLFQALDTAVEAMEDEHFRVLVVKSTIPPSTTSEKIVPYIQKKGEKASRIGVANNPEFLREGHCWEDFIHSDRIVLGCNDVRSRQMLVRLYEPMGVPIKCVTHNTGEFIKYLSNTLLATMISYSNEMAQVADTIGDIETAEAFRILHMDRRWGGCSMTSYVYPGCGYGGYCLPKDTNALLAQSREKGFEPAMLREVISINDHRAETMAKKIAGALESRDSASADAAEGCAKGTREVPEGDGKETAGTLKGRNKGSIGILGLAFKPGSDDVRDTPAARIIRQLNEMGYDNILAYDPVAEAEFARVYPDLHLSMCRSREEVYEKADVLAIVTAWEIFREVKEKVTVPVVDCRYML